MSRAAGIKAIPSSLGQKSSLSLPSSALFYEPLLKAVLQQRLRYNIFSLSLLLCWLQTSSWIIWSKGGIDVLGLAQASLVPLQPLALGISILNWAVLVVPVVLLRKGFMSSGAPSAGSSPAHTLKLARSSPRFYSASRTYVVSAILCAVVHVVMAYWAQRPGHEDPRLRPFVRSRKHPYYLNGRILFLCLSQSLLAYAFLLRNVMLDRFTLKWALPQSQRPALFINIFQAIIIGSLLTTLTLPLAAAAFLFARTLILPVLFKLPVVSHILRPVAGHFIRGSWSMVLLFRHFGLLIRAWCVAFTTVATWECSELLFDNFTSQPISVAQRVSKPAETLVAGALSTDRTFKHCAFAELRDIAADDLPAGAALRTELFADQQYSPNLWSLLVRESLLVLGQHYQQCNRRGKPAPTPAPPFLPPSTPSAVPQSPISLIKTPIYARQTTSPFRTVVDSLASDGSVTKALDAGAEVAHIPELVKTVESTAPVQASKTVTASAKGAAQMVGSEITANTRSLVKYVPGLEEALGGVTEWWTKERLGKVVASYLPEKELDVLIIDVLSHLVCASLTEDRYGVVQRDIPKVLEALISFLGAIEECQLEVNSLYTPPTPETSEKDRAEKESVRVEVDKANDVLGLVGSALKEGIERIVRTFGEKLSAFKFPPKTASKLQSFLDYSGIA